MNEIISPEKVGRQRVSPAGPIVIDVRGADEYAAGHVARALSIPADESPRRLADIACSRRRRLPPSIVKQLLVSS